MMNSDDRRVNMSLNKHRFIRVAAALGMVGIMAAESAGCVVVTEPEQPAQMPAETTEAFDPKNIKPGDDFYGYVNAEYLLNAELDRSGGAGSFNDLSTEVTDRCEEIIREIAEGDRSTYAAGSNEQLIYDAYAQFSEFTKDVDTDKESTSKAVNEVVASIEKTSNTDELITLWGELYKNYGVSVIISAGVDINNENIDEYCLALYPFADGDMEMIAKGDSVASQLSDGYVAVLKNAGFEKEVSKERAKAATYLIIDIAECTDYDLLDDYSSIYESLEIYTQRDYNKNYANTADGKLFEAVGLDVSKLKDTDIAICDPVQWAKIDELLTDDNLEALKTLTICYFMQAMNSVLPTEMGGNNMQVSSDDMAVNAILQYLPVQVGELYAAKYYDEEAVEEVTQITMDIKERYVELIGECAWLSQSAKDGIILKLNNIKPFIGADKPHEIDEKDAELIGETAFETYANFMSYYFYGDMEKKLGTQVVINGFDGMPPQTVNACYDPTGNTIDIPMGIIGGAFYDKDADYYANLGGIGGVVGHELSHAFDSNGMNFDQDGRYNPGWISQADRDAFDKMAQKIADYYSTCTILEVYHLDGEQTLGENLADVSSLECLLSMAETKEDKQHVFESWARVWADVTDNASALMLLEEDVHSPARVRVNAVVVLFDDFYEVYDVKDGDAMYLAPEDRVTRWG